MALATYKSQRPDALAALNDGLSIVEILNPDQSNDPETLGLAGAIRKRLWQATGDVAHLDAAINFYGRGFDVRQDYYTGENLALCLDFRSGLMESADDAMYDRMRARKTREEIIELLRSDLLSPSFQERSDKKWVFATLAACSYALGRIDDAEYYENQFRSERPAGWEIQTFEENTRSLRERNG